MTCQAHVLILDPVDNVLIEELRAKGICVDIAKDMSRDDILNVIANYDAIVVRSRTKVDAEMLYRGARGKLRIVARAGVGLDNIDVGKARKLGIEVINIPQGATQSVAELTVGLMIALTRRIVELCNLVKSGGWRRPLGNELAGKTLLIIGFGRIGRRVAEIAYAIGMNVLVYDKPEVLKMARNMGYEVVEDVCEGLKKADIVTLHVSLYSETRYLLNYDKIFRCLKPGALIVNTSRGAVIETKALLEALEKGIVGGAALDVLENEPPKTDVEKKLIKHPKVVVTPHIGAQTTEAQHRIAKELAHILVKKLISKVG